MVQTEDLGKSHSTPLLEFQAKFENERRLLTFDILTGRLKPGHPQYEYMLGCGIREEEMNFFQIHRGTPDIIGLNYYITSERWLDESLEKYDQQTHGGNGIQRYADTEVVRAHPSARDGFKTLATGIWARYGIPMAVTECHLHCTREEQLRWFKEIWDESTVLTGQGITILGVTAWAMLGSFDWDTLLTKTGTQYESGVFDIKTSTGKLRPTAIATLLKKLSCGEAHLHPVLSASGWWHHPQIKTADYERPILLVSPEDNDNGHGTGERIILKTLITACNQRKIPFILANHLNVTEFEKTNPWAVVNPGCNNKKLQMHAVRENLQYVTFCDEELSERCLKIVIEQKPVSIHQINKVLDLMIDGEKGCWIFSTGDMIFKTEDLSSPHYIM